MFPCGRSRLALDPCGMSTKILILTEHGDAHAYAVAQALDQCGADVVLWHTGDFPSRAGETIHFEAGERAIRVRGPALEMEDFRFDTIWHRRPVYTVDEDQLHPADREFADGECCLFRRSLLNLMAPDSFWVNPPDAAIRAERKPFQHQVAYEVGFATPATLYTNDPEEIREFLKRRGGQIAYKPFRGVCWSDGETSWAPYTSVITEASLVEDNLLRSTPGIYQELVPKAYELRITVIGERVFSAKIRSQETVTGRLDWRQSYDELQMEACEIPAEVAEKCRRVLSRLGLVFGCFDLIVTPSGQHVFLEVNQAGQFLFIERYAGIPLLDAFVQFLLQARSDFEWDTASVAHQYIDIIKHLPRLEQEFAERHVTAPDRSIFERKRGPQSRRRKGLRV